MVVLVLWDAAEVVSSAELDPVVADLLSVAADGAACSPLVSGLVSAEADMLADRSAGDGCRIQVGKVRTSLSSLRIA